MPQIELSEVCKTFTIREGRAGVEGVACSAGRPLLYGLCAYLLARWDQPPPEHRQLKRQRSPLPRL